MRNSELCDIDGRNILGALGNLHFHSAPARNDDRDFPHARHPVTTALFCWPAPELQRIQSTHFPQYPDWDGYPGNRRAGVYIGVVDLTHMTSSRSTARSSYMEWAKLRSSAKFNLATSGIASLPLSELGVASTNWKLTAPRFTATKPLLRAIAGHRVRKNACHAVGRTRPQQRFVAVNRGAVNFQLVGLRRVLTR